MKLALVLWMTVIGHSMEPSIHSGQWVLVNRTVRYEDLRVGDVIEYDAVWTTKNEGRVTHRVVRVNTFGLLVTKGDNNEREDPYAVSRSNYIGRVDCIVTCAGGNAR